MTASMDRTWNGFWHCFQEGTEGGGGPPAPFHRALSPAHRQEQPSRGPPAAQEGRPVGRAAGPRRLSPPPGLFSVKRSCPSFQGSGGGGCPPRPSPEAPTHGGLTLAEPPELVNTLLPMGDLHVSAPEAASHLLLHLRVDLLRVQLHLPLELLQRGVRLPCLQPLPLAHAGQLLLLLPGKATQATALAHNGRARFGHRTSFKSL